MKKLFITLAVSVLAICICFSGLVCFAQDIGTFEDGIKAPEINYSQHSPLFEFETFPNADFEQGFKYWQSDTGELPSSVATIKEENGNHFVELKAGKAWNGICTVRFNVPQPKIGESFVLLYDWRAEDGAEFDVTLTHWWINKDNLHSHGVRMGYGNGTLVKKAENGGFNTSMTIYNHQSIASTRANDYEELYFSYSLNLCGKAEKSVQFDNLKFCKYDSKTGAVYDLNDNLLYENVSNEGNTLKVFESVPEKENPPVYECFPKHSVLDKVGFFFEDYGVIVAVVVVVLAISITVFCLVKRKKSKTQGKNA